MPLDPPATGLLEIALSPRAYGALAYQILGLPLGIAAFTWVTVGLSLSLGLSVIGIGIVLGLAFLLASRAMAVGQGRLAAYLADRESPAAPPIPEAPGFWPRLGALLKDPASWGAQAYLLLRLPLGILGFTLLITLLSCSLSALGLGLFPWYRLESAGNGLVTFQSHHGAMTWDLDMEPLVQAFIRHPGPARLTAAAVGFLGFLGTLHVAVGLTRLEAHLAAALLRGRDPGVENQTGAPC
ncbi:MAG TPA: sensor domain-containing protein [Holophagaceae bacterium]|nr:sensor domain-containing protein [Holophagaceae bacterium]